MPASFDINVHHAQQAAIHAAGALVDLDFYRNHMNTEHVRERIAVSREYMRQLEAHLAKFEKTLTEPTP